MHELQQRFAAARQLKDKTITGKTPAVYPYGSQLFDYKRVKDRACCKGENPETLRPSPEAGGVEVGARQLCGSACLTRPEHADRWRLGGLQGSRRGVSFGAAKMSWN